MTDVLAEAKAEIAITDGASVTAELGRDISVDVNVVDGAQVTVELTAGPELDVDLGAGGAVEVDLGGSAELYFLPDGELDGYYTKSEADERLAGKSDADHDHDGRYYTEAEAAALLALKSDEGHTHDERYYTEAETDALLAGKSGTNHNHDSRYYTETETDALLAAKSNTGHTHDERYYTETEIDTLLASGNLKRMWVNQSPTADYPATVTPIQLDGKISDYEMLLFLYRWDKNNGFLLAQTFPAEYMTANAEGLLPIGNYSNNYNGGRVFTIESDTTISFAAARYNGSTSSQQYVIPVAIYGVNGKVASGGGGGGGDLPSGGSVGDLLMLVAPGDDGAGWVTPADEAIQDDTRPITSGAVYDILGDVETLLAAL